MPSATGWRAWLPFAAVALVYAMVATHRMALPGIFADSINPDYLVARILNPHPERTMVWVMYGNSLLGDRAPVLIAPYHGSQQYWLGLPLYALFGTTVTGVRLTHATFALGVLAALHALLVRAAVRPWFAAAIGVALALDTSFSYAFRTQGYITVAPAAWLLLGLYCLVRAAEADAARPGRWLFASGAFCGLAAVGYFVWAFVLPPVAIAAVRWTRGVALARPAWLTWLGGLAAGGAAYPIGYLLVVRKAGGVAELLAFLRGQQATIGAFRSTQPLDARLAHAWQMVDATVGSAWHQAMMFAGDVTPAPGAGWKVALVAGLPYALWLAAEVRRRASPLLRLLAALPVTFGAVSLLFGDRLGGHHFVTLVPLLYAALGVGLWSACSPGRAGSRVSASIVLVALAALNAAGQAHVSERLAHTRGRGFLSDAIHRFADDLNAMPDKPFLWFPEPALALPLVMLTRAGVPMSDRIDDPEPRRRLCEGRDVLLVRPERHFSEPRAREWQAQLAWDEPERKPYAQADGSVVFEVARFRGRRDGPGCAAVASGK
ncbi:MAG: hypothetical protein IPM22_18570 [Betaproteobacteria bacterium]|nr:hypothetical protein [Betaproteobacteria bacterium]